MNHGSSDSACVPLQLKGPIVSFGQVSRISAVALLFAAAALVASLLWDFSWESTVGIDLVWSPPHTALYLCVATAGLAALAVIRRSASCSEHAGVRLGRIEAPLGAWVTAWGALAFLAATLFDRWWQSNYGLVAGLWHPPQIAKTVAFFAIVIGPWFLWLKAINAREKTLAAGFGFIVAAGLVLTLITVASLTYIYPNRQHSAFFYQLACLTYPLVLAATAIAGRLPFSATAASLVYTGVVSLMVWLLPLFPAKPLVAPIYNSLDHLMPPPFPLLLAIPAVAIDCLFRWVRSRAHPVSPWLQAATAGAGFFVLFIATQWVFAEFLLSDLADNRLFAGGGRHWPFFLKIDAVARTSFWEIAQDRLTLGAALTDGVLAILSAAVGLCTGKWMRNVRR